MAGNRPPARRPPATLAGLQEEERERRMDYIPDESAINTDAIEVGGRRAPGPDALLALPPLAGGWVPPSVDSAAAMPPRRGAQ